MMINHICCIKLVIKTRLCNIKQSTSTLIVVSVLFNGALNCEGHVASVVDGCIGGMILRGGNQSTG
jgi:hypothetical protein